MFMIMDMGSRSPQRNIEDKADVEIGWKEERSRIRDRSLNDEEP